MNTEYNKLTRQINTLEWLINTLSEGMRTHSGINLGNAEGKSCLDRVGILDELKEAELISFSSSSKELMDPDYPEVETGIYEIFVRVTTPLEKIEDGREKLINERAWHGKHVRSCLCGKLKLNGRTARYGGIEAKLGDKEAKFLELLMDNKKVSYAEFGEVLYPKKELGNTNLREKVRDFLKTVKKKLHIKRAKRGQKDIFRSYEDGYILAC